MDKKNVTIIYYTDPICSACFVAIPILKEFVSKYGHKFHMDIRLGGLLRDWSDYVGGMDGIKEPKDVAKHWDEMGQHFGVTINNAVWLTDPIHSSYPPSIAVKSAQLQSASLGKDYLHKLQEMAFIKGINIAKEENMEQAAKEVGLDVKHFLKDLHGKGKENFHKDLELAQNLRVPGFPTLIFMKSNENKNMLDQDATEFLNKNKKIMLFGVRTVEEYVKALDDIG